VWRLDWAYRVPFVACHERSPSASGTGRTTAVTDARAQQPAYRITSVALDGQHTAVRCDPRDEADVSLQVAA
jgi:hypothetical protein